MLFRSKLGLRQSLLRFNISALDYHGIPHAAHAAMTRHLGNDKRTFTGVVAYNDNVGIGALDALEDAGLNVPRDVSLVGHDDYEGRRLRPKLTSVDHRLDEMGRLAAEWLIKIQLDPELLKSSRGQRDIIEPRLAVRGSTAAAKMV